MFTSKIRKMSHVCQILQQVRFQMGQQDQVVLMNESPWVHVHTFYIDVDPCGSGLC